MPVHVARVLLIALLALPWLWPFTEGPVAAVEPYLVSALMAALALLVWPVRDADPERTHAALAWSWLAAAALSAVVGLLQYFDLEAPFFPWINTATPGQAFGNLRQPNQLATLLVMGVLALVWLWRREHLRRSAAGLLGVLLVTALAATASRIGMVELLVCGAALVLWMRSRPEAARARWAVVGALLVYAVAALLLPLLLATLEGVAGRDVLERLRSAESTCGSRFILWRNVLHLIGLKPWTGWGWGELDYAHYITLYDGPRFCHILDNAHNLPLQLAVELGVPVALAVCGVLAWLIVRSRPWAERQPTRQLAWGVLTVIGLHSLVEYPLWYGPFQIAVALSVWLLWTVRVEEPATPRGHDATPSASGQRSVAGRYVLALALLAATGYTAWDYWRVMQVYLAPAQRSEAFRDDPLAHARQSWLFADLVRFAEITLQSATPANAEWMLPLALQSLHFSPETRVIVRVLDSAQLLGRDELAREHEQRLRAAFPKDYERMTVRRADSDAASQP